MRGPLGGLEVGLAESLGAASRSLCFAVRAARRRRAKQGDADPGQLLAPILHPTACRAFAPRSAPPVCVSRSLARRAGEGGAVGAGGRGRRAGARGTERAQGRRARAAEDWGPGGRSRAVRGGGGSAASERAGGEEAAAAAAGGARGRSPRCAPRAPLLHGAARAARAAPRRAPQGAQPAGDGGALPGLRDYPGVHQPPPAAPNQGEGQAADPGWRQRRRPATLRRGSRGSRCGKEAAGPEQRPAGRAALSPVGAALLPLTGTVGVPPRAFAGRARQRAGGLRADPESRGGPGSAGLSLATPGNPRAGCERVLLEASQPCGQSCGRGRSRTQGRGSCADVFLEVQVGSVRVGVLRTAALPGPACVRVCPCPGAVAGRGMRTGG